MALERGKTHETMQNLRDEDMQATHQNILHHAKITKKVNKNSPDKKASIENEKKKKKKY